MPFLCNGLLLLMGNSMCFIHQDNWCKSQNLVFSNYTHTNHVVISVHLPLLGNQTKKKIGITPAFSFPVAYPVQEGHNWDQG